MGRRLEEVSLEAEKFRGEGMGKHRREESKDVVMIELLGLVKQ